MIVVADTSPLNYLLQIGCESLLPALYGRVLMPPAVSAELNDPSTPPLVRQWITQAPDWLEIRIIVSAPDSELSFLGEGEQQAIQLALERHADLLLIDDRRGRAEADRRGIATTGTLGVLLTSARRGLVDAEASYHRLMRETNFRANAMVEESFLRRLREIERSR